MHFTVLLLALAGVTTALLEAIPWEAKSWYKAYLMERLVANGPGSSWIIANQCSHRTWKTNEQFDKDAAALGLPTAVCTFDEFIKHIGFPNSFGQWEIKSPAVFEYDPYDGLEELRRMKAAGAQKPLICAWRLIDHHEFPEIPGKTEFDMAKLQQVIADRVENIRAEVANDPVKGPIVEKWAADITDDLRMVNQWRRSDQSRFIRTWVAENTKYGGSNSYKLLTDTKQVTDKDGNHPAVSTSADDKHLETWDQINWGRTYAQGGKSAMAMSVVRATKKKVDTYGTWPDDGDDAKKKATTHENIIRKNDKIILTHSKPPASVCPKRRMSHNEGILAPISD